MVCVYSIGSLCVAAGFTHMEYQATYRIFRYVVNVSSATSKCFKPMGKKSLTQFLIFRLQFLRVVLIIIQFEIDLFLVTSNLHLF